MFRIITHNFAEQEPGLLASLHDTPWTMIKLAHTARKQGLTEVCLNALSKLYSVATMDVQVKRRRKLDTRFDRICRLNRRVSQLLNTMKKNRSSGANYLRLICG